MMLEASPEFFRFFGTLSIFIALAFLCVGAVFGGRAWMWANIHWVLTAMMALSAPWLASMMIAAQGGG